VVIKLDSDTLFYFLLFMTGFVSYDFLSELFDLLLKKFKPKKKSENES